MTDGIDDAIHQLRRHRGLQRVGDPVRAGVFTRIEVDVDVALPSRARVAGKSATGVRALETCVLSFSSDWPLKAPTVLLRADFPLDLPHINPHTPGQLVSPCLFEGSLDEVLHRFGLDAIVDQLIGWLGQAAAGALIDISQGWEPTRRDDCRSNIVFSAEQVVEAAPVDGSVLVLNANYITLGDGIYATVDPQLTVQPEVAFNQVIGKHASIGSWGHGNVATIIARAPENQGQPHVVGHYQPETVCDLQALIARATACGIDSNALSQALDGYYRRSVIRTNDGQDPTRWQYGMYAVVVLLVQRSAQLIGSPGRSVEVLPYVVRYQISANKPLEQNSSVHPAFHVHALSPALLAMTSGFAAAVTLKQVVILGGGSLGSKVGLHLGRAGCGNVTFVDKESMSPHNLARHALLQLHIDGVPQHKGHRMKAAFEELSHRRTRAFDADVVQVLTDPAQFKAVIPEEATVIVEATASLKVLAAETISSPLNGSAARLVRIAMFGQGRCAFMLLEAPGRLCRVDDLTAALFEHCRFDARLRAQIIGENTDSTRVFVGDNCRSLTSPMSDSTVSRAASLVGLQLERWLVDGMPEEDRLCVGMADTTGIGMSWESVTLGPTRVLDVAEDGGWQVRVLHPVVQAIDRDVRQWLPKETGGALLGRISYQTRTITIAGMIDPPIDSIRERARFVLGTKDLIGSLRDANRDSVGHLAFVGTWHSHPNGGQHSGIDRETLRHIAEDAGGLPAVSLVWTPTGLTCAVERW